MLGSGLAGILIGMAIVQPGEYRAGDATVLGFVCGLCTFACARLMLKAPRESN